MTMKYYFQKVPRQLPIGELVAREPWRLRALCLHHPTLPPQTWDDSLQDGTEPPQTREKRIKVAVDACQPCPVRNECLAAVDLRWDEGVRGGVDLRALKRSKQTAADARRAAS